MNNAIAALRLDVDEIRRRANGRWRSILGGLGLVLPPTATMHGPCPVCGGKDRFRFDDMEGRGTWFCNQCEPPAGDGFALIQKVFSCDFPHALETVAIEINYRPLKGHHHCQITESSDDPAPPLPKGELGRDLFVYENAEGVPVICVQRINPPDGEKTFCQWGRTADGTEWQRNLEHAPKPRPLYRLRRLRTILASIRRMIVIHEGEKACEAAVKAGFPGDHTTTLGGAKNPKHTDFSPLKGREVVICRDNDEPGVAYATEVARLCHEAGAKSVKVLLLPGLPPKGDVVEWFATGGTAAVFASLLEQADPVEPTPARVGKAPASIPSEITAHLHTPPALAQEPNILSKFEQTIRACGMVGEERCAKVLYLALTSRLLDQPISVAIKGLSSSGKSFTTETTLKFFPPTAYIPMTAMSERALVYMKDDFQHRTLVIFEAVALREERERNESNLTAYFVRSLLSEGRIAYPVTVRDKQEGFITKTIVKEGPTNVILTTTATELHGENETRLLSLPTNDSQEQTKAVMRRLAERTSREVNVQEWYSLQNWLAVAEHRVVIPFSTYLADAIPPVAVRLRRDFRTLLRLIETHALLHQCSRDRDAEGRIVATQEDYFTVRELVADLVATGVGATVPHTIRETVEAVQRIDTGEGTTVLQIAKELKLDRSAAQRRIQAARERGYLKNLEEKQGRPARYAISEPLPQELELLPCTLPGCARSAASTHSLMHSTSSSTVKEFGEGVQVCSVNGEEDQMEVVTDVA